MGANFDNGPAIGGLEGVLKQFQIDLLQLEQTYQRALLRARSQEENKVSRK